MTFGDGNAALSPKCGFRNAEGECGEVPISVYFNLRRRIKCSNQLTVEEQFNIVSLKM